MHTANSAVLAMDAIALIDGLGIERFSVVSHDWRSSIAEALAITLFNQNHFERSAQKIPLFDAWSYKYSFKPEH
ncbi:hypothetical protein PH552_01390 [Rhizobium sp. CNPSo 3968]|uniref:hypothetical protein n=2 Tax=Rhizobium TaxID=379 RepID=UPI000DDCEDAD|nr:hypothetical protein [Rhizobium sp. CNPSo 3968]MDK4718004.1 hypothetical protein [Rhizobium sp. CNPSo 3968]